MADTPQDAPVMTDEEADRIRARLVEHETRKDQEAREGAKAKYAEVNQLLNKSELRELAKTATKIGTSLSQATEDRNLFYALDNIATAVEALDAALRQRVLTLGIVGLD